MLEKLTLNNNSHSLRNKVKDRVLDKVNFATLIHDERERSERTNKPFSFLCIDLSKMNDRSNGHRFKKVLGTITSSIRTIDRIGWIRNNLIGVLLPDTPMKGALTVAEKLKDKLNGSLGNSDLHECTMVSTYPDSPDCGDFNAYSREVRNSISSNLPPLKIVESSSSSPESDIVTTDSSLIIFLEKMGLQSHWQLFMKRIIDIVGALFGIVIFSPLMLTIALIIKLTSRGPVLFRQERLGYQRKKFILLKFRSMYMDNDSSIHREYVTKLINGDHEEVNMGSEAHPYYKIKRDPRITPFGRILRKGSLDELPQFFNVLIGHMSLVGPRPPIPYELTNYKNWHRKRVLDVKPGITGLWQVKGRSQTTFEEMVRLDLHYAKNWSLWLDFKIMFATFKAVVSRYGAD